MNVNDIPSDKTHKEIYLKGRKHAILELFGELESDCVDVERCVIGKMHTAIEEINELLGV